MHGLLLRNRTEESFNSIVQAKVTVEKQVIVGLQIRAAMPVLYKAAMCNLQMFQVKCSNETPRI